MILLRHWITKNPNDVSRDVYSLIKIYGQGLYALDTIQTISELKNKNKMLIGFLYLLSVNFLLSILVYNLIDHQNKLCRVVDEKKKRNDGRCIHT